MSSCPVCCLQFSALVPSEQKTWDRELGAGNWDRELWQGTEGSKLGTGNLGQKTWDRELEAGNWDREL